MKYVTRDCYMCTIKQSASNTFLKIKHKYFARIDFNFFLLGQKPKFPILAYYLFSLACAYRFRAFDLPPRSRSRRRISLSLSLPGFPSQHSLLTVMSQVIPFDSSSSSASLLNPNSIDLASPTSIRVLSIISIATLIMTQFDPIKLFLNVFFYSIHYN